MASIRINVPPRDPNTFREDKYKCRWKKCSTVLHNLDTLRKHIGKVHRPAPEVIEDEGYTCWWKKCKFLEQDDNDEWTTSKMFDRWDEWLTHIERDHIAPIAQKYGDGPSQIHVDPIEIEQDRQRYLSNARNQLVTPMINNDNSHPPDALNLFEVADGKPTTHKQGSDLVAHNAWLKAHKVSKDTIAESREVLRAMKKKKESIGPGMDRGGCTLITQEMREIFVQNPRFRVTHVE